MESVCFWITLVLYAFATGGYIYSIVFRNERVMPKLLLLIGAGVLFHSAAIAARTMAQGHFPWSTDYENGLMGGWFIVVSTLYVSWRQKQLRILGSATLPAALLIMGYGVMRNPALEPMAASLKSFWLYIHVFFAWLSFGAYALAMAAGILYLLRERAAGKGEGEKKGYFEQFPPQERLDELMFKYLVFGFINNAVMIAAGAIWAKDLWGNYWSWDPVETWSLVSWLMYGIAIHLRITMGWRGSRFAWVVVLALSTVIINFFGVTLVAKSSLHMFNVR
jgi:cytochrome c-type biogenesis protein CcsB